MYVSRKAQPNKIPPPGRQEMVSFRAPSGGEAKMKGHWLLLTRDTETADLKDNNKNKSILGDIFIAFRKSPISIKKEHLDLV